MAMLAFAAAGSAIGASIGGTFLGMSATAIGWNLGSLAGSLIMRKKPPTQYNEGPRLSDLKVSTSAYGEMIPIIDGTVRMAGQLIWSTPKQEHATTTSQRVGGKNSGKQTVSSTTYSYTIHQAYLLCEGPIVAVRKIWAHGTLVWDVSSGGTIAAAMGSANLADAIRIYQGDSSQGVDPLIESHLGVGLTPAYRGKAYIVFENLRLDKWNGQVPSFEFEVISSGSVSSGVVAVSPAGTYLAPVVDITPDGLLLMSYYTSGGSRDKLALVDPGNGQIVRQYGGMPVGDIRPVTMAPDRTIFLGISSQLYRWAEGGIASRVYRTDGTSPAVIDSNNMVVDADGTLWLGGQYSPTAGQQNGLARLSPGGTILAGIATFTNTSGFTEPITALCDDGQGNLYCGTATQLARISKSSGARLSYSNLSGAQSIVVASDGSVFVLSGTLSFYRWSADLSSRTLISTIGSSPYTPYAKIARDWSTGGVFENGLGANLRLYNTAGTLVETYTSPIAGFEVKTSPLYPADVFVFDWVNSGGTPAVQSGYLNRYLASSAPGTVGAFISKLCQRAGYDTGELNVTAATDTLPGYKIAQVGSLRALLEPLQQMFFLDVTESDETVKFVKRGTHSGITIPEEDMAVREWGEEPTEPFNLTRGQETESPAEMSLAYFDIDLDYQVSAQQDRRTTKTSLHSVVVQAPIVFDANTAKSKIITLLYAAWSNRNRVRFVTTRKYAKLEPTDVVYCIRNGIEYTVRLTHSDYYRGKIEWQGEIEDLTLYNISAIGGAGRIADQSLTPVSSTRLFLFDIPLLRDQDDGTGVYGGAAGFRSNWKGSEVYKSSDGGLSYTPTEDLFTTPTVFGYATTALGNFLGGDAFDEGNTVIVTLPFGDLAGTTTTNVLNGSNAALLGSEIIQFREAELISANTYRLSGFLRGRKGTYQHMSTHAIGETFILLESLTLRRMSMSSAELNLLRHYKAPSFGETISQAALVPFTNTGVSDKPLAPVRLTGGRIASGALLITWVRSTRVGAEWRDYVDASLGETDERYSLEVWNAGNTAVLFTTADLTSPTYTYQATGSDSQTTHFGSPQSSINIKVYQLSTLVGRGFVVARSL